MKKFLLVFFIFLIYGCDNNTPREYNEAELSRFDEIKDSLKREIEANANERVFGDTIGLHKSPVKVLSYKVVESGSGRYRNVYLSFKNVSDKKIDAVKFRWTGEDAFGDPAEMGNHYAKGFGGGFDDGGLNVNQTKSGEWSVLSRNAKKVTLAWATEVVFSDGSKWEIGN